jgi:cytochrome bd-type quinol oxidase subunit 2
MQEPARTNNDQTREALLRAVSGHDVSAQLPIVARTRRAIRVANETRRENGKRGRRTFGISLFAFGALFVLLAPVLWVSLDDLIGGEHFTDLPTQVALVSTLLMLSVVAALLIVWRSRSGRDGFQQDH